MREILALNAAVMGATSALDGLNNVMRSTGDRSCPHKTAHIYRGYRNNSPSMRRNHTSRVAADRRLRQQEVIAIRKELFGNLNTSGTRRKARAEYARRKALEVA